MTQKEEKEYMEGAFKALIKRGVITEEQLSPSPVTDKHIEAFESEFNIQLPSAFKSFLKTKAYAFNVISCPVPEDIDSETIQNETFDQGYYSLFPIQLFSIGTDTEDPLKDLKRYMRDFREVATSEYINMKAEQINEILCIGDWGAGWGPLCIDLTQKDELVNLDDEKTWNMRWFDHEAFDWEKMQYLDEAGIAHGNEAIPDFVTLVEWFLYGKYDKVYEQQEQEDGKERPDYKKYVDEW